MNIPFNLYDYYLYLSIHLFIIILLAHSQIFCESVDQCCRKQNVPDICVKTLCYPLKPPGDFDIYDVFERRNDCSKHLKQIGQCLANGRDHSACCAKEAKDRDESACFSLCRGEGHKHSLKTLHSTHQSWTSYQTCLAINLPSMLNCFEKGYQNSPSPPQQLQVKKIFSQQVELMWMAPELNANLVEHYLIVVNRVDNELNYDNNEAEVDNSIEDTLEDLTENNLNGKSEITQRQKTKETHLILTSLEPGTDYTAYAIAIASNGGGQSLSTDSIRFQTTGVAPKVEAFKRYVSVVPNASSALLACRFHISTSISNPSKLPHLEWKHKKFASAPWQTLRGFRFNQTYFVYSAGRPRQLIMTLEIYDLNHAADYGQYECRVEDEFGVGQSLVELRAAVLESPSKFPPPTPLACCKERNVRNRCLVMCGGSVELALETKRYMPRPFMPSNCSREISKVLSCAMPEVDDSQCCLKERVPRQCMYLCDNSVEPSNKMSAVCLEHVNSVEQCRIAGVEKRPSTVRDLHIENFGTTTNIAEVVWEASTGAEIYHVYWRDRGNIENREWLQKSQTLTTFKAPNAKEIVVVAANSYGISQAAKLVFVDGQWTRST